VSLAEAAGMTGGTEMLTGLVIALVAIVNLAVWIDFARSAWRHHRTKPAPPASVPAPGPGADEV